jgi:hypothetical protein
MNPDKLFDYLDGRLSSQERAALEERLLSDAQLRREFAVARRIHAEMGDSREIVGIAEPNLDEQQRGAVLGRRIMIAFSVLVFVNVLFGIYAIAFMNKKTRTQLNTQQNRNELRESLARTAAVALPTPSLDVEEIKFNAPVAEQNALADRVVDEAKAVGGTATKGLADEHGILIFVEVPNAALEDFRKALNKLGGTEPPPPPPRSGGNTILQVRIVSAQ